MKKIIVKDNKVIDVSDQEFPIHEGLGTWQDCSNDNVKWGWDVNSDGSVSEPVEPTPPYDLRRKREYPSVSDIVDALFKKEAGDSSEWDALAAERQTVKNNHPKE